MSYRLYGLTDEHQQLREPSPTMVHKILRELKLVMDHHEFSGKDRIDIFALLTRYVEETDNLRCPRIKLMSNCRSS